MLDESIFDAMNESEQAEAGQGKSIFGDEFVRRGISKDVIIDLTSVSHEAVSANGKSGSVAKQRTSASSVDLKAPADIDLTKHESLIGVGSKPTHSTLVGPKSESPRDCNSISLFGERTPIRKPAAPSNGSDSQALKKISTLPVGESLFDRDVMSIPVVDSDESDDDAAVAFVPAEESTMGPWWVRPMLIVGARTALVGAAVVGLFMIWPSGDADSDLATTAAPASQTTVVAAQMQESTTVPEATGASTLLSPVTSLEIAVAETPAAEEATTQVPVTAAPTPAPVRKPATTRPVTTVAPTTVSPTTVAPTTATPGPTFGTSIKPTTTAKPSTTAKPTTTAAPTTAAPTTAAPTTAAPTTAAPATPAPTVAVSE